MSNIYHKHTKNKKVNIFKERKICKFTKPTRVY